MTWNTRGAPCALSGEVVVPGPGSQTAYSLQTQILSVQYSVGYMVPAHQPKKKGAGYSIQELLSYGMNGHSLSLERSLYVVMLG